MIKRLLIAIIILGLVGGGIVWFKFFRDKMIADILGNIVPPPVAVNTQTVTPQTWEPNVEAIGTTLAVQGVDLAIEAGGLVRAITFQANETVAKDHALLQVDDDADMAALAAAQATLNVSQTEAERARTLKDRGVGAASTSDTAEAQLERARAEVARLKNAVDQKSLTAPFTGVIGIPQVEVGQYVSPGQIYATLQDLSRINVDFSVPEQQINALALGGKVSITSTTSNISASGSIVGIEPRVDPTTRMISVRAAIENPQGLLYPGQFVRVSVFMPPEPNVIAVDQTAVNSTLYGNSIFVIRQKEGGDELTVENTFVTLGRRAANLIEVIDGLKIGDQIVTSGQNRLSAGARVVVDNSVNLDVPSRMGATDTQPSAE